MYNTLKNKLVKEGAVALMLNLFLVGFCPHLNFRQYFVV